MASNVKGGGSYRVKSGDNLWTIAERIFGDGRAMKRIMYLNRMTSSTIRPGMTLKLPTVIKGRNDRFTITNADIERNRAYGGEGFGLATSTEIASGMAGAGFGGQGYTAPKPPSATGALGDELLKGVSQNKIDAMIQNPGGMPTPSSTNIGVGSAGRQVERAQNAGVGATPARPSSQRPDMRDRGRSSVPAPGPSPQTGNFRPNATAYGTGNYADTFRQPSGKPTSILSSGPSAEGLDNIRRGIEALQAQQAGREQNRIFANVPQHYGSYGVGMEPGKVIGNTMWSQAGRNTLQLDPGVKPSDDWVNQLADVGISADIGITKWANFENPGTISAYGSYFTYMASQGHLFERVPAKAVQNPMFPYSLETMRRMGYSLSADGKLYVRNPAGATTPLTDETAYNPYTGRSYGAGSSGGGGYGGGGGGYGGGGGGGSQYGNSPDGVLRATGSWKGMNFG